MKTSDIQIGQDYRTPSIVDGKFSKTLSYPVRVVGKLDNGFWDVQDVICPSAFFVRHSKHLNRVT
jgi:hypothetical protein